MGYDNAHNNREENKSLFRMIQLLLSCKTKVILAFYLWLLLKRFTKHYLTSHKGSLWCLVPSWCYKNSISICTLLHTCLILQNKTSYDIILTTHKHVTSKKVFLMKIHFLFDFSYLETQKWFLSNKQTSGNRIGRHKLFIGRINCHILWERKLYWNWKLFCICTSNLFWTLIQAYSVKEIEHFSFQFGYQ